MIGSIFTCVVAVIHIYIVILEMFLWESERGRKAFGLTAEFAKSTRVLAANQGLYNGFLAAGLLWGLSQGQRDVQSFFLVCVVAAGAYAGCSVSRRIFLVQGVPALLALALLWSGA